LTKFAIYLYLYHKGAIKTLITLAYHFGSQSNMIADRYNASLK